MNLKDFFEFKAIKEQLLLEINKIEEKSDYSSHFLIQILTQNRSKYHFSTLMFSVLNAASLSNDINENTTKICQNLNEATQVKKLLLLFKSVEIKEAIFAEIENEKIMLFNLDLLNSMQILCLIFLSKIQLDLKHHQIIFKKLTEIIAFTRDFLVSVQKKELLSLELSQIQLIAFIFEYLLKIIQNIEIFDILFERTLIELLKIMEGKRVLIIFSITTKKNLSSTNGILNFKYNAFFQINANLINLLMVLSQEPSKFLENHLKNVVIKQLSNWMNFIRYVLCQKEKKNFEGFLMKRLLSIQDDHFLLFSSIIITNFDDFKLNFHPIFKSREKYEIGITLIESLNYDISLIIEFLMKEAVFLDIFLKIMIEFSKKKENFKTDTKIKQCFQKICQQINARKNDFHFHCDPLIKRISYLLH